MGSMYNVFNEIFKQFRNNIKLAKQFYVFIKRYHMEEYDFE